MGHRCPVEKPCARGLYELSAKGPGPLAPPAVASALLVLGGPSASVNRMHSKTLAAACDGRAFPRGRDWGAQGALSPDAFCLKPLGAAWSFLSRHHPGLVASSGGMGRVGGFLHMDQPRGRWKARAWPKLSALTPLPCIQPHDCAQLLSLPPLGTVCPFALQCHIVEDPVSGKATQLESRKSGHCHFSSCRTSDPLYSTCGIL